MKDINKDPNRIIKLPEVMILTAKSRSSIYEAIQKKEFPPSIPLARSGRSVGWRYTDIIKWIENQEQEAA